VVLLNAVVVTAGAGAAGMVAMSGVVAVMSQHLAWWLMSQRYMT